MNLPDTPEAMRDFVESRAIRGVPFVDNLGVELVRCWDGQAELLLPARQELAHAHGTVHGTVISALADLVCGFAAVSVAGPVVTANLTIHMLSAVPVGTTIRAVARVKRSGKRQIVVAGDFEIDREGRETAVATMLATLVRLD